MSASIEDVSKEQVRFNVYRQYVDSYRHLIFFLASLEGVVAFLCFLIMGIATQSRYLWYPGTVAIVDAVIFILVNSAVPTWHRYESDRADYDELFEYTEARTEAFCGPCRYCCPCCPRQKNTKSVYRNPITLWRAWKLLRLMLLGATLARPIALHNAYFGPPVNTSSCTSVPDYENAGSVYNPNGFFPYQTLLSYDPAQFYAFCPLNRTWAWPSPTDNYIRGYERLGGNVLDCSSEEVGGQVDIFRQCTGAFPDPSIGVESPVLPLPNTTIPPQREFCPGNTAASVCVQDNEVSIECTGSPRFIPGGMPLKLCPQCLNYVLRTGAAGDFGYSAECLSRASLDSSYSSFCYFCPGQGWLDTEVVTEYSINAAYSWSLLYCLIMPLLEMVSWSAGVLYISHYHISKYSSEKRAKA